MKMYLKNFNRSVHELLSQDIEYADCRFYPRRMIVAPPIKDHGRFRTSIDAFLSVLDRAEALNCIVDESMDALNGSQRVVLTNVDTNKTASLRFSYNPQSIDKHYAVSVVLNSRQVSLRGGARKAGELIEAHLLGRRKTGAHKAQVREDLPEDDASYIAEIFEH